MPTSYQTPGVYVNELNAFPNSVVPVATAIPAFIGYTPGNSYNGKSYLNQAVKIESFPQFMTYFGRRDATSLDLSPENEQYRPIYYPVQPGKGDTDPADLVINNVSYYLEPDPTTIYYLYNSIKLFYANGGSTCYVISVGKHGDPGGKPKAHADRLVNGGIKLEELKKGLDALANEDEPTMIVVPDAALLKRADNQTLNQAILDQCGDLKSRVALFDIHGADVPAATSWKVGLVEDSANDKDEEKKQGFRSRIGMKNLSYGVAYFPFLKTTIVSDSHIDYRNLGNSSTTLTAVLSKLEDPKDPDKINATALAALITKTAAKAESTSSKTPPKSGATTPAGSSEPAPQQVENALRTLSSDYAKLHDALLAKMNILPPCAALAGVYTSVDNEEGVWHAPANITLNSVTDTTVKISDNDQKNLNVDANAGKSINAIRLFAGKGVTVWGARTLDGNSDDWRYVNVRRTLIFIEQSMKLAANAYVFEPNTANTWSLVTSMLNNFLTNLWSQGALVGATPAEAFSVSVGLGLTMTGQDVLDGKMIISVKVAVSRPAEFIIINIQQQMQTS